MGDTCFVKISSDVWYKMTPFRTMQPESREAQEKSTIHDLIQEDSEDCVILTSSTIELISPHRPCHALFVKRLHMRDGVTFTEARRTCVISVICRMENEMMRAADQCAQALPQDKIVLSRISAESLRNEEDINAGMAVLEQMICEKAEEALRDATIDDVVTRCTKEDFKVKMFGRLINMFVPRAVCDYHKGFR